MSHHFDSPLARQDPRLDISDVYLFRGATGTVFVMNVNPLSGENGFHPDGLYEFKVDTDGDAVEDTTFRVTFGERDADGGQALVLRKLDGEAARDRDDEGSVLAEGATEQIIEARHGISLWAGAAADPFYVNGAVVGAVKHAVATGAPVELPDQPAANLFAGTNVCAIVLEVPDEVLAVADIAFWGVTALPTDAGGWQQINRCAQPLINTIFNPDDEDRSSDYNRVQPSQDREVHGPVVCDLVARAVAASGAAEDPKWYAEQVRDTIFPDVLRYRVGTPATYGFATRNGRGLTECAPEVMFAVVLNRAVPLGLSASAATGTLRTDFPYLSTPV